MKNETVKPNDATKQDASTQQGQKTNARAEDREYTAKNDSSNVNQSAEKQDASRDAKYAPDAENRTQNGGMRSEANAQEPSRTNAKNNAA